MSDRPDRDRDPIRPLNSADVRRHGMRPDPERARVDYALARADQHAVRELYFLDLAVLAPDDESARALELYADEAYRDAVAITEEHDLDR
jgi:hypothetical protein